MIRNSVSGVACGAEASAASRSGACHPVRRGAAGSGLLLRSLGARGHRLAEPVALSVHLEDETGGGRRLWIAVAINVLLTIAQVIGGIMLAGSAGQLVGPLPLLRLHLQAQEVHHPTDARVKNDERPLLGLAFGLAVVPVRGEVEQVSPLTIWPGTPP